MVVGAQRHAPAALPPKRPGTSCIGGWAGRRCGFDEYGKSHPNQDSFPGRSST